MRKWISLLAAGILLSGCFDLKQDFEFTSDGNATMKLRMAIDAALIAMLANQSGDSSPFCGEPKAGEFVEGVTVSTTSTTEGGDMVCLMTATGPADKLVESVSRIGPDGNARPSAKQGEFTLTKEGSVYTLVVMLPNDKVRQKEESGLGAAMEAMMLAKMSGRSLAWSVTAPKIIETTGAITEDGRTASYSRPLADLMTSSEPTGFTVVFDTAEPGFFGWLSGWFK